MNTSTAINKSQPCCNTFVTSILNSRVKKQMLLFLTFLVFSVYAFAQQPAANLDQLRNGSAASPNDPGQWVNGNLGSQNSHYSEGMSAAYRTIMTNMPANTVVNLTLEYDVKHSGRHAIDYLTSYDRIEPHVLSYGHTAEEIDPTIGTSFMENLGFMNFTIPLFPDYVTSPVPNQPEDSFNNLGAAEKQMTMWGGTITGISYGPLADLSQSNEPQAITVTFTTDSDGGEVLLAWGGHIGSRHDWGSDINGVPLSAGGISGSPYHMRLIDWNLNNLGNQDRSLSADAVAAPPDCEVTGADLVCPQEENIYTVAVEGATNPVLNWELILSNGSTATFDPIPTNSDTSVTVNSGTTGGNYIVKVTVTADEGEVFCQVDATVISIEADAGADAELTCTILEVTLDGSGSSTNPDANLSYSWSGPGGFTADTEDITVSAVGTYTLTVTDLDNGCFATDSAEVSADENAPTADAGADAELTCTILEVTLDGSGSSTNPDANLSYSWSGPGGFTADTEDITVSAVGTYTLTVTDLDNGCFATDSAEVTEDINKPEVSLDEVGPFCIDDDSVQLQGSPLGGVWSGDVSPEGVFNPANGSGTFTVTYTFVNEDGNGCEESATISIVVNPLPEVFIDTIDPLCIDADAVQLVGSPAGGTWSGTGVDENGLFDPSVAGAGDTVITYSYTDNGGGEQDCNSLVLTAVFDGDLSGGLPKGVELYVLHDIANLSIYGLGSANNGGGTDGQEFTFPEVSATAGSFIYVASESTGFNSWFGFDPDYTTGAMGINGDDAIELFKNGVVIDTYGDPNVNGDGEVWDYTDSWAYRNASTGPDGETFVSGNWTILGLGGLDGETGTNAQASNPIPVGTYFNSVNTCASEGTGCSNSAEITISVEPLPDVSIEEVDVLCINDDAYQLVGSPDFGTWSGIGVDENGLFDPGVGSQTITYTYIDDLGCENSATVDITVSELPTIEAADPVCNDPSEFGFYSVEVTVNEGTVSSAYTTTDQGGNVWLISDIPNGTNATITVTNQFDCESSIEVQAPDCICIELEVSYTDVTCFGENDGTITAIASPGATITVNGLPYDENALYEPGEYTITAFYEGNDNSDCLISEVIEIIEPEFVDFDVTSTDVTALGLDDGTITVTNLSEGATYTIQSIDDPLGPDLSMQEFFAAGQYIVTATVLNNESSETLNNRSKGNADQNRVVNPCIKQVLVTISEPEMLVDILYDFVPEDLRCRATNDTYMYCATTGTSGDIVSFSWNLDSESDGWEIIGSSNEDIVSFKPGRGQATFTVSVIDEFGNIAENSSQITSNCNRPNDIDPNITILNVNITTNRPRNRSTVYPNPIKNKMTIKFDNTVTSDVKIEVSNQLGKVIRTKQYDKSRRGISNLEFDFSGLPNQMYYVKIITDSGTEIKRVILNR